MRDGSQRSLISVRSQAGPEAATLTIFRRAALRGLRGAVPIVLATFPLLAGLHKAEMIFNIVFFIVFTSALLQGSTIPLAARWFGMLTQT